MAHRKGDVRPTLSIFMRHTNAHDVGTTTTSGRL
jgi:hypothetical protein